MDSPDTYEQLQAENQRLRDQLAALTEPGGALALPWFDHVNDAIFVVDTSWRIRQWNRAAEEIYGWSRADVLGRHINDTIPVLRYLDYASETEAAEVLYREGTWRSRFQQIARDGRELVIDGSTRAILSERLSLPHGSTLISKMQAVALQVSEYQRREEALLAALDLATLICWGEAALRLHRAGANARQAFVESAADVWVDRIVPLKGADLDPEIERVIAGYVSANAPSTM